MVIQKGHYHYDFSILIFLFVLYLHSSGAFPSILNKNVVKNTESVNPGLTSESELERHQRSSECGPGELLSKDTGKCHLAKTQGPCGQNMTFDKTLEDPSMGRCDCLINQERALIYEPTSKQCYAIYTQGPCGSGSWLVIKEGSPACELNPCSYFMYYVEYEGTKGREFVWYQDDCVELNQPSPNCPKTNEIISLVDKGKTPACVKKGFLSPLSLGSAQGSITCQEGDILSGNECHSIVTFDLE